MSQTYLVVSKISSRYSWWTFDFEDFEIIFKWNNKSIAFYVTAMAWGFTSLHYFHYFSSVIFLLPFIPFILLPFIFTSLHSLHFTSLHFYFPSFLLPFLLQFFYFPSSFFFLLFNVFFFYFSSMFFFLHSFNFFIVFRC